jgi:hypothetical protein
MAATEDILEILASLALFSDLSRPELDRVVHTMDEEWFAEGQRILRQGFSGSSTSSSTATRSPRWTTAPTRPARTFGRERSCHACMRLRITVRSIGPARSAIRAIAAVCRSAVMMNRFRRIPSKIFVATCSGLTGSMPAEMRRVSAGLVRFSRSNPGVRVSGG